MFTEDGLFNKSIEEKFGDIIFDSVNRDVAHAQLLNFIEKCSAYELLLERNNIDISNVSEMIYSDKKDLDSLFKGNLITIMSGILTQIE